MSELERVRAYYERRGGEVSPETYSYSNPGMLFMLQERQRAVLATLRRYGLLPLAERRVLDVGCGSGGDLRDLVQWGADPRRLVGLDLMADRLRGAVARSPHLHWLRGDAARLPFADASFDLVSQATLFTSILDAAVRSAIATEMRRVVRPGGLILWYDFWASNPSNRNARGIGGGEIRRLFPDCRIRLQRLTLAPPLARILAPRSLLACQLLAKLPLLRTHYLAAIERPS